jgi:hypothetical protein
LFLLSAGWIVGLMIGGIDASIGAIAGCLVGTIAGCEIGYQEGFFEITSWDRLIYIASVIGFAIPGAFAAYCELPSLFIALVLAVGAGFGALLAKYLLRFFISDPPPTIR